MVDVRQVGTILAAAATRIVGLATILENPYDSNVKMNPKSMT